MRPEVGTDRSSLARTITVELDPDLVAGLRRAAAERLVNDLLGAVVSDKLVAAVLDN